MVIGRRDRPTHPGRRRFLIAAGATAGSALLSSCAARVSNGNNPIVTVIFGNGGSPSPGGSGGGGGGSQSPTGQQNPADPADPSKPAKALPDVTGSEAKVYRAADVTHGYGFKGSEIAATGDYDATLVKEKVSKSAAVLKSVKGRFSRIRSYRRHSEQGCDVSQEPQGPFVIRTQMRFEADDHNPDRAGRQKSGSAEQPYGLHMIRLGKEGATDFDEIKVKVTNGTVMLFCETNPQFQIASGSATYLDIHTDKGQPSKTLDVWYLVEDDRVSVHVSTDDGQNAISGYLDRDTKTGKNRVVQIDAEAHSDDGRNASLFLGWEADAVLGPDAATHMRQLIEQFNTLDTTLTDPVSPDKMDKDRWDEMVPSCETGGREP